MPLAKMIVRDKPKKFFSTQYIFASGRKKKFNLPFFVYKKKI